MYMTEYDNDPQQPAPRADASASTSAPPVDQTSVADPHGDATAPTHSFAAAPPPWAAPTSPYAPQASPQAAPQAQPEGYRPYGGPVGPHDSGVHRAAPQPGQHPVEPGAAPAGPFSGPGHPAPGYPAWGQPVGAAPPRQPSRFGRVVATGTAAVVLAVTSGLLGGVIATRLDDDAPTTTAGSGRPAVAAPVIQRDSLATIAANVQPSVVSVSTGTGEGSGVVLSADGYVLTNNHVVAPAQGGEVQVAFSDGKTGTGKIVGSDARTDLAVVKVDGISGLTAAKFGDSGAMQVGDTVLALGSPLGLEGSVTAGIVSALDRTIRVNGEQQQAPQSGGIRSMGGLLQTDAPINPGNSGGALVNLNGEVIGINTAIATSGQGEGSIGVGFAIPSNRAKQVAEQLRSGEKVSHAFLGVNVTDAEGGNGAVVASVQPDSPAAELGLQRGDVVTKLGAKTINDSDDLVSAVQTAKVNDRMELTYVRNGEQKTATVTLGEAS
jgi:putative serine protease PepD